MLCYSSGSFGFAQCLWWWQYSVGIVHGDAQRAFDALPHRCGLMQVFLFWGHSRKSQAMRENTSYALLAPASGKALASKKSRDFIYLGEKLICSWTIPLARLDIVLSRLQLFWHHRTDEFSRNIQHIIWLRIAQKYHLIPCQTIFNRVRFIS